MKRNQLDEVPKNKSRKKSRVAKSTSKKTPKKTLKPSSNSNANPLEHHILNFSRLAENEKSSDPFASALSLSFLYKKNEQTKKTEEDIHASISYLSSYLVSDECEEQEQIITKVHVAGLIFPWVTKALFQQQDKSSTIIWQAFSLSLEILLRGSATKVSREHMQLDVILGDLLKETKNNDMVVGSMDDDSNGTVSNILTQGMMNKLIPCFVRTSFQPRDKDLDPEIIAMACKSFGLILTSDIYRPTMDYVCDTLIQLVHEKCSDIDMVENSNNILPNQATIVYFSMQLLLALKARGRVNNPKKIFQLTTTPEMLISMSYFSKLNSNAVDIIDIVKRVVAFALYDPLHLNEFRSMNLEIPIIDEVIQQGKDDGAETKKKGGKDSKKKNVSSTHVSYLRSFFNSLISIMDNQNEKDNSIELFSQFIPILVEGFIFELLRLDKDSKKRKMKVDATAKIHFRFFATLIYPLVNAIKDKAGDTSKIPSKKLTMLKSILQCSDYLQKYDVYLPSFVDPGNQHLNFLTAIGEVVLCSAERQTNAADTSIHISVVQSIFNLTHLTFHDKLSRVIMCATSQSGSCFRESPFMKLLGALCNTYKKLRQMDHLVKEILTYADTYEQFDTLPRDFIRDAVFCQSLSLAIKGSPIGLTETVWDSVNQHIMDSVNDANPNAIRIGYSVEIFVIILKAVRVGSFSSKAIKEMCERTMASSVSKLLFVQRKNDSSTDIDRFDLTNDIVISGLNLWGWIVHVHTKCCFWLNEMPHEKNGADDDAMCGSKLVPVLMVSINSLVSDADGTGESLEALQLLACHLLQQMHSSIYQQEQIEALSASDQNENVTSTDMIKDAKILVKFVVHAASSEGTGWKILCENLVNWIPYAEEGHIDLFLRWFFITLACGNVDQLNDADSMIIIPLLDKKIQIWQYSEERAAAIALQYDASFFETPGLFHRVAPVASDCVQSLLYGENSGISSDPKGITSILKTATSESPSESVITLCHVKEGISVLAALELLISTFDHFEDTCLIFEKVLSFHVDTIKFLSSCPSSQHEAGIDLLCAHRKLLSKILMKESPNGSGAQSPYIDKHKSLSVFPDILKHIIGSTYGILNNCKITDESMQHKMVTSGSEICYAAAMFSINSLSTSNVHVKALVPTFREAFNGTYQHDFVIKMIRPSLQLLMHTSELKTASSFANIVHPIAHALVLSEMPYCVNHIGKKLADCARSEKVDANATVSDALYFISDLLSMNHLLGGEKATNDTQNSGLAVENLFNQVTQILNSKEIILDTSTYEAALYFFGSIVGNDILPSASDLKMKLTVQDIAIRHFQEKYGRTHPIIDSVYAKILNDTRPEDLSIIAANLLSISPDSTGSTSMSRTLASIHFFHTMIHVIKGQKQRETLSSVAKQFLPMISDVIYPFRQQANTPYEEWSIQIRTAQALTLTLIEKNDLISLKGHNVSSILATTTAVFHRQANEHDGDALASTMDTDRNVYASSCAIASTLLKYYPKQLYGCAPSFTSALRCLLDHVMKCNKQDTDVTMKIQEFKKICELLPEHKEIFKKHIMHVVLYYVDGIDKMDPWIKTHLEPSVFFLLDTLSEFETKQMNTLMNATGKALFQSVFKNFRKSQYKGQF